MPAITLATRITEVADGLIGVMTCLLNAQNTLGEQKVAQFLDKVPEKGEALWLRFRAAQRQSRDDSFDFNAFITSVLKT